MSRFSTKAAAVFGTLITAGAFATPAFAAGDPAPVSQGDRIDSYVSTADNGHGIYNMCTVGYVNQAKHTAVIARHCVGSAGADGLARFETADGRPVGYTDGSSAGVLDPNSPEDWVNVRLYNDTAVNPNGYTTNNTIPLTSLSNGQQVCMFGLSSGNHCGTVNLAYQNTYNSVFIENMWPLPGDSGGPAWLVNPDGSVAGSIGIVTDQFTHTEPDGSQNKGALVAGIGPALAQ